MASTIRDVARLAGVGSGTVSRVINNSPKVDPRTRARVLQVIAELDFHPSAIARRLSTGKTRGVGVAVPFMTRPSIIERLRGIEGVLATSDYDLIVFNIETTERRTGVLMDLTRGDRIDGLILVGLSPSDVEVSRIERAGLPAVLIDAHHPRLARVVANDVEGGRMAARHLLELGHRKIAFLGELPRVAFNFPASRLRHRGVRQALACAGLDLPESTPSSGSRVGPGLVSLFDHCSRAQSRPPASSVRATFRRSGRSKAAHDVGLDVPSQLSIVGYDDLEIAGFLGLTTIHPAPFRVRDARREDAPRSDGGQGAKPAREVIEIDLIRRFTTGPAPA